MLVLSRKLNDEIVIGEDVVIRVVKIKGNTVRIGISAPQEVSIMRGELPRREIEFAIEIEEEPVPAPAAIEFRSPLPRAPKNRLLEMAQANRTVAQQVN